MASKTKKDEVRSVRLDTRTLARIERAIERHHGLTSSEGFSYGEPHVLSQAQMLRIAVLNGLDVIEKNLDEQEKKRKKGGK